MILSDASIREELEAGRIAIDPLDERHIQPSSVDLRVDRFFRVFRNDTTPYIDPKLPQEDLTELVEVADGKAFILHPGEFVLGSTLERVSLPTDLVARLEGKSSLGRLGLLIHSSLPGSEPVLVLHGGRIDVLPIETVVRKHIEGAVVGFDPQTFTASFFPITGWFEGPPDRIYEVRLASGRSVRVTAGHNLFSLDRDGNLVRLRTRELCPGVRVAIPRRLPEADLPPPTIDLRELVPEEDAAWLVVEGPSVKAALRDRDVVALLRNAGYDHYDYYRQCSALPFPAARLINGFLAGLGPDDRIRANGARGALPIEIPIDREFAWLLGICLADGYRRRGRVVISNTRTEILHRAQAVLASLGQPVYRKDGVAVTCSSRILSALLGWMGTGRQGPSKRLPMGALGWPRHLLESLMEGLLDGDGAWDPTRDSFYSSSSGLVEDLLLLGSRLERRTAAYFRSRAIAGPYEVVFPHADKLLPSVPLPDQLLVAIRRELGLSQRDASAVIGFSRPTDLCDVERRTRRDAVRLQTLRRIRNAYRSAGEDASMPSLDRLVDGDLAWDTVLEVRDSGEDETIFDLEVRPGRRRIENFVAGSGGVFVSNTAGFVDAGWDGHLTLELSNVANLPIAIYPGMKIGQISFLRMDQAAEQPYGSHATGSKYQGQRGPTPSRYYLNFAGEEAAKPDGG